MVWSKSDIWTETNWTKGYYQDTLKRSLMLLQDPFKKERIEKQECRMCFYSSKIGGACMTYYNCKNCGEELLSGSTHTNKLCKKCAKELSCCLDCGGDIDMKIRREK